MVPLSPAELEAAGRELYGPKWKGKMANALGLDPSMIWRYLTEQVKTIPGPVTAAVRRFLRERRGQQCCGGD